MARKAAASQDKYRAKLDELQALVSALDGLKGKLAGDLLESYVQVYADFQYLNSRLMREGLLIEVEKGAAGNRHTELLKHPAFDMRRNCITQMADLANKINRFIKDDAAVDERDEFESF